MRLQNTEEQVRDHIRSFPAGSSVGPDGLRPQHLADQDGCAEIALKLTSAIAGLVKRTPDGSGPRKNTDLIRGNSPGTTQENERTATDSIRLLLAQTDI